MLYDLICNFGCAIMVQATVFVCTCCGQRWPASSSYWVFRTLMILKIGKSHLTAKAQPAPSPQTPVSTCDVVTHYNLLVLTFMTPQSRALGILSCGMRTAPHCSCGPQCSLLARTTLCIIGRDIVKYGCSRRLLARTTRPNTANTTGRGWLRHVDFPAGAVANWYCVVGCRMYCHRKLALTRRTPTLAKGVHNFEPCHELGRPRRIVVPIWHGRPLGPVANLLQVCRVTHA